MAPKLRLQVGGAVGVRAQRQLAAGGRVITTLLSLFQSRFFIQNKRICQAAPGCLYGLRLA
jgi:hypothetical protein